MTSKGIHLKNKMHLDHALIDQLWVSVLQVGLSWVHVPPKHRVIFINFRHGPAVRLLQQSEREGEVLMQLMARESYAAQPMPQKQEVSILVCVAAGA